MINDLTMECCTLCCQNIEFVRINITIEINDAMQHYVVCHINFTCMITINFKTFDLVHSGTPPDIPNICDR